MPKIVDKESKKREILQVSMQVFAKNGVARTRMADIAEKAGIGKGTIYEYFRSKEEIFTESFHYMLEMTDQLIANQMAKTKDPQEKMRVVFLSFVNIMEELGTEYFKIMLDFWAEGVRHQDEDKKKIFDLNQFYDEYRKLIMAILQEGIQQDFFRLNLHPYYVASGILGAMDGLMLQWIMQGPQNFNYRQAVESLLDSFLHGIQK